MRSSLARFHRVFKSKATRLFWLAKKNVIKAQLELGQASNHFLRLPPSDCL